ncbi:hypothetical protein [uncultured Methylobacterium sp.]|uniref:hypothetical protein n=1 Tax=uncultured Methylobacterium sp. TaxID=157278 RepID=UPI0035CADB2B
MSSSAPATVDVITAIALPARLPAWADDSVAPIGTMPVDASLTLRLVEHASASMARMEQQLETISVCGLGLLRQTRDERQRFQHEMQAALHAAETWKQHAMAAEAGLRDATLRAWEADLRCRECESALEEARQRADAAETRAGHVEFYLRKIDQALRSRFLAIDEFGQPSGRLIP